MSNQYGIILDPHFSQATPASRKDDYKDAMFKKMDWVIRQANEKHWRALIVAGDFFSIKPLGWEFMTELTSILRGSRCPVYSIAGNHDIYYENLESLCKTPLGLLFETGIVKPLNVIEDGLFTGLSYSKSMTIPQAPDVEGHRILVCHAFLGGNSFDGSGSDWLYYPDIINAGYSVVIAGHDHAPYPAYKPTGSDLLVLRPGSLSRGTKHIVNRNRQPVILVLSLDDESTNLRYEYLEVPAAKPSEIFSEIQIEREDMNKGIREFASRLEETYAGSDSGTDFKKMLESMSMSDEVRSFLTSVLLDNGILL
jgi:DNA repair protein SbcD/Mre11